MSNMSLKLGDEKDETVQRGGACGRDPGGGKHRLCYRKDFDSP